MKVQSNQVNLKSTWEVVMWIKNPEKLYEQIWSIYTHNKEKLFSIRFILETNLFHLNLQKWTDIKGASG